MNGKHIVHEHGIGDDVVDGVKLTPEERRRQRGRNIAIGVVLGALFVLFYVLTIARLGANVFSRPF
ncbi:hypothetical protein [Pseudochelatococcus sp. G4_1912]|uniref:hypothetical protein n=1 Tax=Pseudochelatococcus sp. G4_1912 TaxID=3114288 RepID=UPI0039C6726D